MAIYTIAVQWTVTAEKKIEANSLEDAKQKAKKIKLEEFETSYLDDSFEVNHALCSW